MTTVAVEPTRPVSLPMRWWRGRPADPAWVRPALLTLLALSAVTFLWGLGSSGYANQFYSAAVQAGSASWKAFFFGSSDAANSITVDKPPAALWPMALSVRLFGLSSWSILVPQALMGVASVGVVYAAVRRGFGPAAGLLSGAVFALTPVAALMFRFNNPDAMLCLLSVLAIYCVVRAVEAGRTKWMVAAGALLGFAFLVKTLQAWLIVPVLAVVFLASGPAKLWRRVGQLLAAGAAMVAACGWWIAIVELWPASSRPYIGGSQTNSFLELTFGYNGLGRITGEETGSLGGGMSDGSILRMFTSANGGQIAWLLPAALILLLASLYLLRRNRAKLGRRLLLPWRGASKLEAVEPRADARQGKREAGPQPQVATAARRAVARRTTAQLAQLWLWGGSMLITALVFSFMAGIFHEYYTIALAPYIAATVGIGAVILWRRRRFPAVAVTLAVVLAVTAMWAFVLLGRSSDWLPWLRWTVLTVGLVAAVGLVFARRLPKRLALLVAALGLAAALAGPIGYTAYTVGTSYGGSIITAGPATQDGGMGGPGGGGPGGQNMVYGPPGQDGQDGKDGGTPPNGNGSPKGQAGPDGGNGPGGKGPGGQDGANGPGGQDGANGPGGQDGGKGNGPGGFLNGQSVSDEVADALSANADDYTWVAAATGSQNASSFQLASEQPVMAIGGFNGSDPSPTLDQFKEYVADGEIHYYVSGGGMMGGPNGDSGSSSKIAEWVEDNFKKVTVDGTELYDLTQPDN
ncbi:ArnT family glycosyltransferase [Stackebrandtia nassauensis]|uniref:Glycosyl transferase family 39 n=1 Tax=Stackebrandtia nassauensis (strain DSM 44728 / CIP 108903 / NRRL B-16338 / NBRC 102104 / LLR-40K-21) TaxID=446470 RepID=D3QBZ6_STANL|nr:glycosyltransferase family 39 protein [Stackebrandtia nassauensis]ADD44885.1 glycosyl transferase family 39 [Stackebrandtia nassauensis DSM 44728]